MPFALVKSSVWINRVSPRQHLCAVRLMRMFVDTIIGEAFASGPESKVAQARHRRVVTKCGRLSAHRSGRLYHQSYSGSISACLAWLYLDRFANFCVHACCRNGGSFGVVDAVDTARSQPRLRNCVWARTASPCRVTGTRAFDALYEWQSGTGVASCFF